MPVDSGKHPPEPGLEDFVALESRIDVAQAGAQIIGNDALGDVG